MNMNWYRRIVAQEMSAQKALQTVGLKPPVDPAQLKQKKRQLSLQHHPDRNNGDDTKMREVNQALDRLELAVERKENLSLPAPANSQPARQLNGPAGVPAVAPKPGVPTAPKKPRPQVVNIPGKTQAPFWPAVNQQNPAVTNNYNYNVNQTMAQPAEQQAITKVQPEYGQYGANVTPINQRNISDQQQRWLNRQQQYADNSSPAFMGALDMFDPAATALDNSMGN